MHPHGPLQRSLVDGNINFSQPEPNVKDITLTTSHLAALFGNIAYCCRPQFAKNRSAVCKIASRYTYGNQSIRPVDLAMATGRAEIIFLAYTPFVMQWPVLEEESSHAAPTYLFHNSWLSLTGAKPERLLDVLELIIPHLFHVNAWMNGRHWTLLHFAVSRSQEHAALCLAATTWLICHCAARGAKTNDGNIPLHLASRSNETSEIVELLLRTQVEEQLDAVNDSGQTALDLAVGHRIRNRTKIGLNVIRSLFTARAKMPGTHSSLESLSTTAKKAHDHELVAMLATFKC